MSNAERESKPGRDISYCIDANYAKGTNTTLKSRRQLVMEEHTIAYSKSHRKNHIDARGKINDEANTLNTGDGCTSQSTGNYVFTKAEDMKCLNPKARESSRVYSTDEESPTLRATKGGISGPSTLIAEEKVNPKVIGTCDINRENDNWNGPRDGYQIYDKEEISPALRVNQPGNVRTVEENPTIRIRKLTPTECERLQGYPDGWTALGLDPQGKVINISNTQRYKMCGNGISSPVPADLFPKVFGTEHIRLMSLFSGCGGTEMLLPENFEVVGHCEFDKYASSVLRYHYPSIPNFHDVTKLVDREDVPEFDMLVGGFPCQSWSIAGLRKGFDDERGQLIYNVFDILRKHKPKYLCLENVKGLLSKDGGDAFEAIMEYLSSLGYDLDFEVVNSKYFGLAQNRERVFIFGKLR